MIDFLILGFPDLAGGGLGKGACRAQQRVDPHPEQRAGATVEDRGGNACDIADADTAAERHGEALERKNTIFGLAAFRQVVDHAFE